MNRANINFMTAKLTIDMDADEAGVETILEKAKSIIKKIEPDVFLTKV